MGFLSKIGKSFSGITDSINNVFSGNVPDNISKILTTSVKDGFINALYNIFGKTSAPDPSSPYVNEDAFFMPDILSMFGDSESFSTLTDRYTTDGKYSINDYSNNDLLGKESNDMSKFLKASIADEAKDGVNIFDPELKNSQNNHRTLSLPNWDYGMFINERTMFQKGLDSPFGQPGYFYFKLFFKFDTQFGLFGGILNNASGVYSTDILKNKPSDNTQKYFTIENGGLMSHNGAYKYLNYLCFNNEKYYRSLMPNDRKKALLKFTKILSYINCNAPWFFKSIRGLKNADTPIIGEFSQERAIELECNVDAIDMRLTTLFDLYKFAAYDVNNYKEVLPENMRKFDMLVLIFNTPIKTLHTAVRNNFKVYPYKTTNFIANDINAISNLMSFKVYEFTGCQFDVGTISSNAPDSVNNETPFNLGNGTIKITYDRCSSHISNEFSHILFGSTGFYWSYDDEINNDRNASLSDIIDSIESIILGKKVIKEEQSRNKIFMNKYLTSSIFSETWPSNKEPDPDFDPYVDIAESLTKNNLVKVSRYALGNLYGENRAVTLPPTENNKPGQTTDYFNAKTEYIHNRKSAIRKYGDESLRNLIGNSRNTNSLLDTNIGINDRGPGSDAWNEKIERLKGRYNRNNNRTTQNGNNTSTWTRKYNFPIYNRRN